MPCIALIAIVTIVARRAKRQILLSSAYIAPISAGFQRMSGTQNTLPVTVKALLRKLFSPSMKTKTSRGFWGFWFALHCPADLR
jgi:hypothetical protein